MADNPFINPHNDQTRVGHTHTERPGLYIVPDLVEDSIEIAPNLEEVIIKKNNTTKNITSGVIGLYGAVVIGVPVYNAYEYTSGIDRLIFQGSIALGTVAAAASVGIVWINSRRNNS